MGSIYLITNLINGKQYVGQTKRSVEDRYAEHIQEALNTNKNLHLYNSIRKYGIENFSIDILEDNVDEKDLDRLEIYYIGLFDTFHNGYNNTVGGGGVRGYHHNKETRYRIGKSVSKNMWKINTPERTAKIIAAQKGRKFTYEHRKNISIACKGKRKGEENAFYGKHHSKESKKKMHDSSIKYYVQQLDFETDEVLNTFDCVEDASNYCITNNYTTAKLSSVMYRIYYTCIGKQSHAYGFKWKYIERCNDYPEME